MSVEFERLEDEALVEEDRGCFSPERVEAGVEGTYVIEDVSGGTRAPSWWTSGSNPCPLASAPFGTSSCGMVGHSFEGLELVASAGSLGTVPGCSWASLDGSL